MRAVFFDIDDTLFHFQGAHSLGMKAILEYAAKELGLSQEQVLDGIQQAQNQIGERLGFDSPAFHNRQIRFQNAMEILGKPVYPYGTRMSQLYWGTVLQHAVPEPGILELIKLFRKKGFYIGTGTDMTSYVQNQKLEQLGIAPLLHGFVTSEEAGRDKPCPEIFLLCAEKAGCEPQECLFIGDNLEKDVLGPRKVGMKSACYRKYSGVQNWEEDWCIDSYLDCICEGEIVIGDLRI